MGAYTSIAIPSSSTSFANVLDDAHFDMSAERIRDRMSVMASPNGNLDEVREGLLLQAVQAAFWLSKRNHARVDDVVQFLQDAKDSDEYADSPTIRGRLDEMIILLDRYTLNGIYGTISTQINQRTSMTPGWCGTGARWHGVAALSAIAVMFSLIIYIENRMHQSPRGLKKLNVIDEAGRLMISRMKKWGSLSRKATVPRRHTGAYITITQNIVDFDSPTASSAACAAWELVVQGHSEAVSEGVPSITSCTRISSASWKDMINSRFGQEQWFSSLCCRWRANCSRHRLFVDPLSRAMYSSKGPDFGTCKRAGRRGRYPDGSIRTGVPQL